MANACKCGKTTDLRPYGPGGSWVCFACATATPADEAATKARFLAQLDAACAAGSGVALATDAGPVPLGRGFTAD